MFWIILGGANIALSLFLIRYHLSKLSSWAAIPKWIIVYVFTADVILFVVGGVIALQVSRNTTSLW